MNKKNIPKNAFTLIELSISILIISILMAGVFSISTGSIVNSKANNTSQKLNSVYKAIGNFLAVNKRLPCPASLLQNKTESSAYGSEVRTASGCIGAGVYRSTTNTNLFYGTIPTRALNLSSDFANDAYGNKLNYFIDQRFTFDYIAPPIPNMTVSSFGTASATNIMTINERQVNDSLLTLTNDAIIVISSSGLNLRGGFNANNSTQNTLATEVDESSNQASSFNNGVSPPTAVFDNIFIFSSANSDVFDDILLYKTRLDFISDFNVANLIACDSALITDASFTPKSLYNGQYLYAQSACATDNQFIKILKCGFNGVWQWVVSTCP